jgi:hypothetical protein
VKELENRKPYRMHLLHLSDSFPSSFNTMFDIIFDRAKYCFVNIRYGLVARISRSHTLLYSIIRSEEAGVQFPVSETSFAFS